MKTRPILMAADPVRNILAGRQTQDRRPVKFNAAGRIQLGDKQWHIDDPNAVLGCPYGQPGDRLYLRETWAVGHGYDELPPREIPELPFVKRHYAATEDRGGLIWRPSIHMPRWASRITLEITGVRVERLQDISLGDICKEGLAKSIYDFKPVQRGFDAWKSLWESCYGPGSWDANPWVWVLEFKRVESEATA